jgi:hypothetical protein
MGIPRIFESDSGVEICRLSPLRDVGLSIFVDLCSTSFQERRSRMPKLRVHNFAISLDGYGAGPNQSLENPLGVGGESLHDWVVATRAWREIHGMEGGVDSADSRFVVRGDEGIGATIMGRNMFGPIRGPWTGDWRGWWGDNLEGVRSDMSV